MGLPITAFRVVLEMSWDNIVKRFNSAQYAWLIVIITEKNWQIDLEKTYETL